MVRNGTVILRTQWGEDGGVPHVTWPMFLSRAVAAGKITAQVMLLPTTTTTPILTLIPTLTPPLTPTAPDETRRRGWTTGGH